MRGFGRKKAEKDLEKIYLAQIDAATDEEIRQQIAEDPDTAPIADEEFYRKARLVMPEPKPPVSLRIDSDVIRAFREEGAGYQAHMNEVLRGYATRRGWISAKPERPPARRGRPRKSRTLNA